MRGAGVDDRIGELVRRHERAVQIAEHLERRFDVAVQELGGDVHLGDAALDRAVYCASMMIVRWQMTVFTGWQHVADDKKMSW